MEEEYDDQVKKNEHKMIICRPDHPNRCKASASSGTRQCGYLAIELSENKYGDYCLLHGGAIQFKSNQKKEQRNYNLGKWQSRVNAFADNSSVKSLREEIGITRMLLEQVVTRCPDEQSMLFESPRISDLVSKLEKLVSSCHRLEMSTSMLLDKSSAINIATKIVEVISRNVSNPDTVDKISEEILTVIIGQKNEVPA